MLPVESQRKRRSVVRCLHCHWQMGLDRWVWPVACPLARGVRKCVRHKLRNRGTHARSRAARRRVATVAGPLPAQAPLAASVPFWCASVSSVVPSLHLETRIHYPPASGGHRQRRQVIGA